MKKLLIFCLALVVSSTGLLMANGAAEPTPAASAPVAAAQAATSQPVEITLAYPVAVDAPIAQMMNDFAKGFMAENPNVTVKMVFSGGYNDVKTTIQTAIQGKADAPELAVMLAADLYDLINAKFVVSFDEAIAKDKAAQDLVKDILPAFMENSYYNGKLYGLPFQRSAVVLYYNADLLAASGFKAPTSWVELAKIAQALTLDGGRGRWGIEYPTDWPYWTFQPLAIGAGRNVLTNDVTVNFNAPEVVEAIRFYNSLSATYKSTPAGVQANWGSAPQNFAAGKTAMIVHSSGSLSTILANASFKVGVMAVPGKTEGSYASVPGGGNIYLTPGHSPAENDAALKFARYLLEPSRVAGFSKSTGYIPYRKATLDGADWKTYSSAVPQADDIAKALGFAKTELSTQALAQVRTVFHKYLQAAFNGQLDAKAAMDTAQAEAEKILADYK